MLLEYYNDGEKLYVWVYGKDDSFPRFLTLGWLYDNGYTGSNSGKTALYACILDGLLV